MGKKLIPLAPVALCRLLSPYTTPVAFIQQLDSVLEQPALLELVVECANRHMLMGTLYACLREHQQLQRLPGQLRDYLHCQHTFMQARNQRLREQTLGIITPLNQMGVTPLLLKGSDTLFYPLYPDQGCRFMSDLDILLPSGTMPVAQQALAAQGYAVPEQYQQAKLGPNPHHDIPLYKSGHDCAIELHYQPLSYKAGTVLDTENAFAASLASSEGEPNPAQFRALSPTHKLLHSFIHSEICHSDDRHDRLSIRQLDYFVRLLNQFQGQLDWPWLAQHLDQHGYQDAFARYAYKARQLYDVPQAALPVAIVQAVSPTWQRRYGIALKMAMRGHYPGLRFKQGLGHLLSVFEKQRLAGQYPTEKRGDYAWAVVRKAGSLLRRCANPRRLALELRRVLA